MNDELFNRSTLPLLQLPSDGWSRILCASRRSAFPRLTHRNLHVRPPRIASNRHPAHVDDGFDLAVLLEPDWGGWLDSGFHFAWRKATVRCMRTVAVVPMGVGIETVLNGLLTRQQHRAPRPRLDAPIHTFHLRVEMPRLHAATNVGEAQLSDRLSKRLPELAPVIGDQESRASPPLLTA